jgi:hypothetical protein
MKLSHASTYAVTYLVHFARERLLMEGRERALLYKTAILTGMRQGGLDTLLVGHPRLVTEAALAPRD